MYVRVLKEKVLMSAIELRKGYTVELLNRVHLEERNSKNSFRFVQGALSKKG